MKLESAKRNFKINNKFIQIETKQKIVEENCTLNDVEVKRGLAYVRAGRTPLALMEIPIHILEPVKINDIKTHFSTTTSVAMECGLGTCPRINCPRGDSGARKDASRVETT